MKKSNDIISSQYINDITREYGMYTVFKRGIPSISDGLKVSQRIALWLIKGVDGEIKTASLAGNMLSSLLYVHGEKSASDTISNLAAPYMNNICLIEGIGLFGNKVAPKDIGAA